jgi:YggT family protein
MTFPLITTIHTIFNVIYVVVLAHVILTWLPVRRSHPAVRLLDRIVEPMLRPFRRLVSPWRMGGLDISPMLLIVSLWVVEQIVDRAIISVMVR